MNGGSSDGGCRVQAGLRNWPMAGARRWRLLHHRRRVQRSLQLALVDPEHWYDDPVINSDTRDRWLVRDNRAGLYLGPLWRWALCTGSELPAWSRLSYLQARLPDGDKCRLAQLHLPTWHDEFRWEPHDPRVQRRQREHEQQLE